MELTSNFKYGNSILKKNSNNNNNSIENLTQNLSTKNKI